MDFIDNQAEESEGSESSVDDDQPKAKKAKMQKKKEKKKSKRIMESSDEEDDEEEEVDEEMKQFIASDEDEVDDDEDNKSERSEKFEEELDDDDIDLIEENLDLRSNKKQREVHVSDSEDEDDIDKIKKNLFDQDDDEQGPSFRNQREEDYEDREDYSDSEQSENDFIVTGDGERPSHRRQKRRDPNMPEGALDEAREVFGVEDFNLDDFYDEDEDQLDEEEDEMVDEDGERIRRVRQKESKKSTLLDTMEPAELEKGFLAPRDKKIQLEDRPERFQLRKTPVSEASENELDLESKWIFRYAFSDEDMLSRQKSKVPKFLTSIGEHERMEKEAKTIATIKEVLKFIRNHLFEIPFVAFYRKESVSHVFDIQELWRIHEYDEKWCHLQGRKDKLIELMKRMQNYQMDGVALSHRQLTESDMAEVYCVETHDNLTDAHHKFQLYYGPDIARMQEWERSRAGEGDETAALATRFKQCLRSDKYKLCVECGIGDMVSRFGLTSKQFAENLEWKKHDIQQDPMPVDQAAKEYITNAFPSEADVINGAVYMMAKEISCEPLVRQRVRTLYRRRVKISARPTKQGREQMDDTHPLWNQRYIKYKDISDLENEDFLIFKQMKEQGNMLTTLSCDTDHEKETSCTLIDRILSDGPFRKDEFSDLVMGWNEVRERAVRMALESMLIPFFEKELTDKLIDEAKRCVIIKCIEKLARDIEPAAYRPSEEEVEEDDEEFSRMGETRVMGIAYNSDMNEASFGAMVDQNGSIVDYVRLVNFTNRSQGDSQQQKLKADCLNNLKKFIERRRPHVIGIAAENMDAVRLQRDVEDCLRQLQDSDSIVRKPSVYIMGNEAAKVYMNSRQAASEHPEYPPLLRQAVSLSRILLDPLVELAHLWNHEEDFMCLSFHSLQSEINKDELSDFLSRELISKVNEVGVDVNKCLEHSHTANMLQFVAGLGPRKAGFLLKTLKQHDNLLESRTKLVTLCKMGPKVFMNCAGFIKIDTSKVAEKTDAYVEVLDGSRVHPETYEWARKMAVDAIEVDDNTDPTAALEEILQTPDRLRDLDLDAFAEELKRQGFGEKKDTLYDIAAELNQRYRDTRVPFLPPSQEELFTLLSNGSKYFAEGRRVLGTVIGVQYKKLSDEERMDDSHPRNSSNMIVCKHCHTSFHEAKDLWNHTSTKDIRFGGCPGVPVGVRIRLENDVSGFIPNKMLSDNPESFKSPLEKVQKNGLIWCRIVKIDPMKMSCLLSSRTSDLNKDTNDSKDRNWDADAEQDDTQQDELLKQQMKKQRETKWVKRVIQHPNFYNVTFSDAERLLSKSEQGDVVIRPSSKGTDRLTITWKVAEGVLQNIDVFEEEKEQPFTLGKKLYIETRERREEFEDLNEILARWIQPMAANAREIIQHKCFLENIYGDNMDAIVKHLQEEKRKAPSRFPYTFTPAVNEWAGKFLLSYMTGRPKHEYITVTPEGLRFRYIMFESLNRLLAWFKVHYKDNPGMGQNKHVLQRR